jgi:hypothetical protein
MSRGRGGWRSEWTRRWLVPALPALLVLAGCTAGGGGSTPPGHDGGTGPETGGDDGGPAPETDGGPAPETDGGLPELAVSAADNVLDLPACGVTPATFHDVPAGTYTIQLDSSTLSKGVTNSNAPSQDDYVVVHLPLPAGDPDEAHRFFMLNGVGASRPVTLPEAGTIEVMFIDSDDASNHGQAVVSLDPGGLTTTVDAVANVLRWRDGCSTAPATIDLSAGTPSLKLIASTLSSSTGASDPFVLVRSPSELAQDDHRYVMLNGLDASATLEAPNGGAVRAWFISAGSSNSGQAAVQVAE